MIGKKNETPLRHNACGERTMQIMINNEEIRMSTKRQFISFVVYIHNDKDRIEFFLKNTLSVCERFKQCEVIFVDDCSKDNSLDIIKKYYVDHPADYIVSIIRLGKFHGMETAMNAGRDMSIGDYVYEFDDIYVDYESSVIIDAYNKCLEGNDIVRVATDVPIRFTSKMFYRVFNKTSNLKESIGQESFRLLSRRGINRIISMDVDIPYRKAIYMNSGLSTATIRYESTIGKRPPRVVKNNERIDLAVDSFIYFTSITQHITLVGTILFALLSVLVVVYALVSRSLGYHVGAGYVSTMIFLAIGFTSLFALMAIMIRYLSIIIDLVFKKQKYLIADIEKISSK